MAEGFMAGSAYIEIGANLGPLEEQLQKAERITTRLTEQTERQVNTAVQSFNRLGASVEHAYSSSAKADQLTEKLRKQQEAAGFLSRQLEILDKDLKANADKYEEGSTAAARKTLQIDKLKASLAATERSIVATQHALDAEATATAHATNATQDLTTAAEHSTRSLSTLEQIGVGALRQVGAMAVSAGMAGARALEGLAVDSIKVAGDFQAGMNQFEIAVGKTIDGSGKSLDDFRQLFIQLGKDLPVSTSEVEKAATEMARGGIDPATIAADGLRRTIQFAAASLKGDLTEAATISAKTMQAWTQITDSAATKTTFLAHAQDLMTQATTAASTTVDQLFLGLSNVGGSARLAGLNFDETVTALAQLTPSFSSSADAGTSFKVFLQSLLPTGKAQIEQMKALGLYTEGVGSAFYDASGKFIGMQKAEELLHDATKNLTDAQREQALKVIFGTDAIRAAAVISTQGAAGYDGLAKSISQQSNVAQAAAITQRGLNTAWENAKGSIEALEITVGSKAVPTLTNLLNKTISPGINEVTAFADAVLSTDDPLRTLEGRINDVIPGFTGTMTVVSDLRPAVVALGVATTVYATQQLPTLIPMLYKQAAGWAASVGPLGLVAAGIYAAVRAEDDYLAQARLIVERQDKSNESMTAGKQAMADYTTNLAGQSPLIDGVADKLTTLMQAHDDVATTLQRWDTADAQTRRSMHLSNAEIDAMRGQVKTLDGQIMTLAGSLGHIAFDKLNPPKGVWSAYSGEMQKAVPVAAEVAAGLAAISDGLKGDDFKAYEKAMQKAFDDTSKAFDELIGTEDKYRGDSASAETKHWQTIAAIDKELHGKITKARRDELEQQRKDENTAYAGQTADLQRNLAEQVAANRSALGQMLTDRITAFASDPANKVDKAKVDAELADIEKRYGLAPNFAARATLQSFNILEAGLREGSGRTVQQLGRDTDAVQRQALDVEKTYGSIKDLLTLQVETKMKGDDPVVIGQAINREWGRAAALLQEFPGLAGKAFGSVDELMTALAQERTLKIHTEADTGDVPDRLKGIQDQADAIDTRAPAYVRVQTDAEITKQMLEGTTASLDALDRHPVVDKQVTTNAPTITGQVNDTTTALDLLDRHPVVNKELTTNAPTITGFIVDTGNAYSSLSGIPDPDLHITTNAEEVAILLGNVTAAMGNIPTSKAIRIAAGIDPMLVRKSPAPIEQVMMAIERFEARDHIFKVGTRGSLDGLASYMGAKDPLSYQGSSIRDMPDWLGYTQELGNGLRLLGDQTPAVQDLGNGLKLLGDQWARQAATMTDLVPNLPQLADGYTAVADAAEHAAAAARATDDILKHATYTGTGGMGGYLNKAGSGMSVGGPHYGDPIVAPGAGMQTTGPDWGPTISALGSGLSGFKALGDQAGVAPKQVGQIQKDSKQIADLTGSIAYQAGAAESSSLEWQNHLESYATRMKAGLDAIRGLNGLTASASIHASTHIVEDGATGSRFGGGFGDLTPQAFRAPLQSSPSPTHTTHVTNHHTYGDIHIHQQPGESGEDLADRVLSRLKREGRGHENDRNRNLRSLGYG